VVDLARAFPEASIVMGHCGAPLGYGPYEGERAEVFADWKAGLTDLARCDNVEMKLGGMRMRQASFDYRSEPAPPTSADLVPLWAPLHRVAPSQPTHQELSTQPPARRLPGEPANRLSPNRGEAPPAQRPER
jgi:hypothetical protein